MGGTAADGMAAAGMGAGGTAAGGMAAGAPGGLRGSAVLCGFVVVLPGALLPGAVCVRASRRGSRAGSAGLHAELAVLVLLPESGGLLPVGAAMPDPMAGGGAAAAVSRSRAP